MSLDSFKVDEQIFQTILLSKQLAPTTWGFHNNCRRYACTCMYPKPSPQTNKNILNPSQKYSRPNYQNKTSINCTSTPHTDPSPPTTEPEYSPHVPHQTPIEVHSKAPQLPNSSKTKTSTANPHNYPPNHTRTSTNSQTPDSEQN